MELDGAFEAVSVSVDEEFWGRTRSAAAAAFRACRFLCGRSAGMGIGGVDAEGGVEALSGAIKLDSGIVDGIAPRFMLKRAFSNNAFPEKYSFRSFVVPATTDLTFEALEKFLVRARDAGCLADSRHDRHTVLRPLDRKALADGYRIIISCCWMLVEALGGLTAEALPSPGSVHFDVRFVQSEACDFDHNKMPPKRFFPDFQDPNSFNITLMYSIFCLYGYRFAFR